MQHTFIDQCLINLNEGLNNLFSKPARHTRTSPSDLVPDFSLSNQEKKQSASLMRINHTGEVCAQALYQGQALTARSPDIQQKMQHAADEEIDHLAWCFDRLVALDSHPSYLNPAWYLASLAIGIGAGLAGDRWSLGFLAETERQVVRHLEQHLKALPQKDEKSRAVVKQMKIDEEEHATLAVKHGAQVLPASIKKIMRLMSKVMTKTVYWV